jgi:Protein of unknown function (DUF669)
MFDDELPEPFDTYQQEGTTPPDLLAPGEYVAEAITATTQQTKKGDGYTVKVEWRVAQGDHEGRHLFQYITFLHPNSTAQNIGRAQIKDWCVAVGFEGALQKLEPLLFKPVKLKVAIAKDESGQYPDQNKVTRILPVNPKGPTSPSPISPASKPTAAASAVVAGAASTASRGSAPWQRG